MAKVTRYRYYQDLGYTSDHIDGEYVLYRNYAKLERTLVMYKALGVITYVSILYVIWSFYG